MGVRTCEFGNAAAYAGNEALVVVARLGRLVLLLGDLRLRGLRVGCRRRHGRQVLRKEEM